MERTKIGDGFYPIGYGRSSLRKCCVYLINGFAYAKHKSTWESDFEPLSGDMEGYVRVNYYSDFNTFHQCSAANRPYKPHLPYNKH